MKTFMKTALVAAGIAAASSASALTITDTVYVDGSSQSTATDFTFYVADGTYTIFTQGPTIDPVIALLDSASVEIATDDDSCPDSLCGPAGAYSNALISSVYLSAGLYTLQVWDHPIDLDLSGDVILTITDEDITPTVPLPAGLPMLAGALALFGLSRRRK